MFRSLHMKLMLIMTLLIILLMTVVGAFLINSVSNYYTQDFYTQMSEAFQDADFWADLNTPVQGEEDSVESIVQILDNYYSVLGVDNRSRKYYVLDGSDGHWLASSDKQDSGQELDMDSWNLMQVLAGADKSDDNDPTSPYMDVAVAVERGPSRYIIYVRDNGTSAATLNNELMTLIVEALLFGLVITVLLSFLLSKTLITPIERLTEGAERVADGDFSQKLEVASRDEIGVLTGTFNDMARQLRSTLEAVENERNKLGTLFLHMTDGVVAFSRDGTVIQSNPAAEDMLGRAIPIGGSENYDTLFSDIAPLQGVLAVEPPGYLDGARTVGGPQPGAAAHPLRPGAAGRRAGGDPRRHRAAQNRGDAPGIRGQRVPRAAHPPDQHPLLRRDPGGQRRGAAPRHGKEFPGGHPQRVRPDDPHRTGSAHPLPV